MPGVDLVNERRQERLCRLRTVAAARAFFGDLKDALLGAVDELACRQAFIAEHRGCDVGARAYEFSQQRALAHDGCIRAHIGCGGRVAHQGSEIGKPANLFQEAGALQLLGDCDRIAGLSAAGEAADGFKDLPMVGTIEIARTHHVGDILPGDGIQQETTEQRLLGLHGMRRSPNLLERAGFATRFGGTGHSNSRGNLGASLAATPPRR